MTVLRHIRHALIVSQSKVEIPAKEKAKEGPFGTLSLLHVETTATKKIQNSSRTFLQSIVIAFVTIGTSICVMETVRANAVALSYYVSMNLMKIMVGSALIGYGVANLQQPNEQPGGDTDDDEAGKDENNNNGSSSNILRHYHIRYITSFICIGSGLFFALPCKCDD